MEFENLEKKINKLDTDIEALRRAKQYLSNKDEINKITDGLNKERQEYADQFYLGDGDSYRECLELIKDLMDEELEMEEQKELLENMKNIYGRKSPNITKKSYGLNAWLKFMDVQCEWVEKENSDWSTLIINDFTPRTN